MSLFDEFQWRGMVYGATEDAGEYRPVPAHPDDIGGGAFPTLRLGNGQADAAVVAYGGMVPFAEAAAEQLADQEELDVDIVVPSQLAPLPRHALIDALTAYDAVVIAEETHGGYGIGAGARDVRVAPLLGGCMCIHRATKC